MFEPKNKYLSVPLDERTMNLLDKRAEREGVSRAALVRKWIEQCLSKTLRRK